MADKTHKCEICGKYFTRNNTLIRHLQSEYGCNKNANNDLKQNIINSLKIHTLDKDVDGSIKYKCKYCNLDFNDRNAKYRHQKTCIQQAIAKDKLEIIHKVVKYIDNGNVIYKKDSVPEINDNTKINNIPDNSGQIYLIQEREFIKTREPIYKIGKTTKTIQNRMKGYPKGSRLLLVIEVENCHTREKELIKLFDDKFKKRTDIGTEYFEGCEKEMIAYIVSN